MVSNRKREERNTRTFVSCYLRFVMIVAPTLSRQYCRRGRLIARQTDCIELE